MGPQRAQSRALWGTWRTDNWNPVFIAPVFTALEYGAFEAFGVGTWQARTVPVASGLVAIIALMAGLSRGAPTHAERAALIGGALLAVNYTWVMWNRAALMESTMTMFIVVAWAAYAHGATRRPLWGVVAGIAAVLAFFTKAAAAFFIAAIVAGRRLDDRMRPVALAIAAGASTRRQPDDGTGRVSDAGGPRRGRGASSCSRSSWPHWQEFQFYNWQMTVTRKPTYDLASFIDRASLAADRAGRVHAHVARCLLGAALASSASSLDGATARPAERLLVLWVLVGLARARRARLRQRTPLRHVRAGPHRAGVAAGRLRASIGCPRALAARTDAASRCASRCRYSLASWRTSSSAAALVRVRSLDQIVAEHHYRSTVRCSAAMRWPRCGWWPRCWPLVATAGWLGRRRITGLAAIVLVVRGTAATSGQYGRWAAHHDVAELSKRRSTLGDCSRPARSSTANSRMVWRSRTGSGRSSSAGFGNYADRLEPRRCALYTHLQLAGRGGYESQEGLMREILDRYPNRRSSPTFDVDETPGARPRRARSTRIPALPRRRRIQSCARLATTRSRRTPTAGFDPSTTTRCSSTTGAPRCIAFLERAGVRDRAAVCSTPAAAAAACRCRWPSTPTRSSASIPSIDSAMRA